MPQAATPERQIEIIFQHLNRRQAGNLSSRGLLSNELNSLLNGSGKADSDTVSISPRIAALYASAAVEMWLRSVHSFLISVSVTESSHIWASVCGYYSSHYSVRALAHILGYFLMHQRKYIASLEILGGRPYCRFAKCKNKQNREHVYYWNVVKLHPLFIDEPIYTLNHDKEDPSDVAHRNIANYYDHLNNFPNFQALDEDKITERVDFLSKIQISSVPIPSPSRYPDTANVQLIAYHRIVKFRRFLDNILGSANNIWNVYRNPAWCPRVINYQLVEPEFIAA